MNIIVFVGPTLSPRDVRAVLPEASLREPASCGDVAKAALERPDAIAVIDGYFQHRLAVWHKEILWALAGGIRVYGAASMGALRAAELADFGMVGVGRIFEWFRSGTLEDDDEVAIAHQSAARGYQVGSDAMVNIRATLEHAASAGIVSSATAAGLREIGKAMFFAERSFPAIIAVAQERGLPADEVTPLRAWLENPDNVINQKRDDALALLHRIKQDLSESRAPERPSFVFQFTEAWYELTRRLSAEVNGSI